MEHLVDTMADKSANNREAILGSMFFNDLTEITISHTGFYYLGGEGVSV